MSLQPPTYVELQSARIIGTPTLLLDKGAYSDADFVYLVKFSVLHGTVDDLNVSQVTKIEKMLVRYMLMYCRKEVEEKSKLKLEDFTVAANAMQNPAIVTVTRNKNL